VGQNYHVLPPTAPVPAPDDALEALVRRSATVMLQAALEAEATDFLERERYQRTTAFRGYRNGHLPRRTIGVGFGGLEVQVPRISDVPPEISPEGFRSQIVERYQRSSRTQARLFCRLYLEGLASGDFEPVFRALVGETVALSPASILRLKEEWKAEYETWKRRPLTERYLYLYADGFYLKAGLEKTAILVIVGVRADGHKELLAMEEGYRESTSSWAEVLRALKKRGLKQVPLVAVGDGALGLWAALDHVYPATRHQRCWNHRALNVLDQLPKRLWKEARRRLHEIYDAPTRQECTRRRDVYCAQLRAQGQAPAAACLDRDWEEFTTFYDFPQEHWTHLRTTNPIESIFDGVRLRTKATKRMQVRENALYLIFKLVLRLTLNWRAINAPNQLRLLLAGHRYVDGQLIIDHRKRKEGRAA